MFRIIRSVYSRSRPIIRCVADSTIIRGEANPTVAIEEKIKVGDYHMNYLKVGHGGHTVLCIPGFLGSVGHFKPQVDGFDQEKFTLVVWEPPGYGKSRPPEKKFDPHVFESDADTAHDFMKALNIPNYSLLGWSCGAVSAMILAAKYPSVVKKLAIFGAFSYYTPRDVDNYKFLKKLWSEDLNSKLIEEYGLQLTGKYCDGITNDTAKIIIRNRRGNICKEFLKDIMCPTYILHGRKDFVADFNHLYHLHANIKGSRIHLYPDGIHEIHHQYPEDFNRRVQEFLLLP